ncbi:MAG: serine/threonine protein kinase, partial [Gammaproteobacteria bacterium]|nr:serine/threonine protein kinase [Gammaproteobacteria bacterium]
RQQAEVVSALQGIFASMREHRLSHGDMKASNLLWLDNQLFLIDLDASRKHRTTLGWRLANHKDRKRFLKNWQSQPELLKLFSGI